MNNFTLRVDYKGKHTITIGSLLGIRCIEAFAADDFCPLCDAHPSSGHVYTCPLVQEAIGEGETLKPEPDDQQ